MKIKFKENYECVNVRIPKGLEDDLIKCLKLHPPDFSFKYNIDCFLYIISKITSLYLFKRFKNLRKVPLSSVILRFELGKHYKRYIEYLIQYNFIDSDNHYVVGDINHPGKCKCYGVSIKYKNNKLIKYVITKKTLLKKFLQWKEEKFGKIANDELLGKLYQMMNKFTVDIDSVKKYLDESVKNRVISRRKANIELLKCEKINDKTEPNVLFIVKDTYGRIHSNFTNLSRYIRENFLYLDGEKVVQLDVISSQASLLYTLFKDYTHKILDEAINYLDDEYYLSPFEINTAGSDVRDKYVNQSNSYSGNHIYKNEFSPTIKNFGFTSYVDMAEATTKELENYKHALENGIYELFQDRWSDFFGVDVTRSHIKKEWIKYVFGQNKSPFHTHMNSIWDHEFPLLNKILKHFKNGNHKPLAHVLQRKESDIIYKSLCPKINKINVNYFTVHDCLVVKESDANDVYDIFEDTLKENGMVTGVAI